MSKEKMRTNSLWTNNQARFRGSGNVFILKKDKFLEKTVCFFDIVASDSKHE